MKKTKIVCGIGPSNSSNTIIREMIENGMDVARFDLGYVTYDFVKEKIDLIRKISTELNKTCGIMLDTNGPEFRIGTLANGKVFLNEGDEVNIYSTPRVGTKEGFSVVYDSLVKDIHEGMHILFSDAKVEVEVTSKMTETIICKVIKGGFIFSKETVHIPRINYSMDYVSEKDKEDIAFAHSVKADFLALSFVRSHFDVLDITDLLIENNDDHIEIISKIENENALDDIDAIISTSDGIMVARGDLGIEMPLEKLPGIQKELITKAHFANKLSLVSTEMLASMENELRPTRAEVSDVYNAVFDLSDAVVLSKETSIGDNPVEAVKMMNRIICAAENDLDYRHLLSDMGSVDLQDITSSIAHSVVDIANRLEIKGIITTTNSGYTAKKISMFRPSCPVVATSPNADTVSSLTLNYGIYPILTNKLDTTDAIVENCKKIVREKLKLNKKDLVIITGGFPAISNNTNFMKVEEL